MIKICISVTSHALDPPLSQTVTPSRTPVERDALYGRPLIKLVYLPWRGFCGR